MFPKLISMLAIFFIFPITTQAGKSSAEKKASYVVSAIINNEPTSAYLQKTKKNEEIVSVEDFKKALATQTPYKKFFNEESEFATRLKAFVKANGIHSRMLSAGTLETNQNIYLNILFFVEMQKLLSNRKDIYLFGTETIHNLNAAIFQRIKALYDLSEEYLNYSIQARETSIKMKMNFVNIGLDYEHFLNADEQWVNEIIELDKKNVAKEQNLMKVLQILTNLSTKKINSNLKKYTTVCSSLFS